MRLLKAFGLPLSILMLLLAAGSGLSAGPPPPGPARGAAIEVGPAQNAPWFVAEIDTAGDLGRHVSVAVSDSAGTPVVSYYDADDGDLRVARHASYSGNCGPGGSWYCETVDSDGDVGR